MRKVLKWVGRIVGVIVLLVLLASAAVFAISDFKLNRTYEIGVAPIAIPTDPASIAEGKRKARLLGCYDGCHGDKATGKVWGESFLQRALLGKFVAPDLTRVMHELSDRDLVRVIRHGVLPDGHGVSFMPSDVFYDLSDADLGKIIAYLRSLPRTDGAKPAASEYGLMGRWIVLTEPDILAVDAIDHDAPRLDPGSPSEPKAEGRYLAHLLCSACHGRDLSGGWAGPNLTMIANYTPGQFRTLARTSVPPSGKVPPIDERRRTQFAGLTDSEIDAMYAYLGTALAAEQRTP